MNREKTPNIVPFFIFTAASVICWAFFEIYRNFAKTPPLVVPPEITAPFNPKLDAAVFDQIAKRYYVTDSEIQGKALLPTSSPIIKTSPTPTASASAQPL